MKSSLYLFGLLIQNFITQVLEVESNKNQMSWPITLTGQTHENLLVLLSFGLSLLIKLDRSLILKSKTFILMPSNDIFERVSSSVFCRYSSASGSELAFNALLGMCVKSVQDLPTSRDK